MTPFSGSKRSVHAPRAFLRNRKLLALLPLSNAGRQPGLGLQLLLASLNRPPHIPHALGNQLRSGDKPGEIATDDPTPKPQSRHGRTQRNHSCSSRSWRMSTLEEEAVLLGIANHVGNPADYYWLASCQLLSVSWLLPQTL